MFVVISNGAVIENLTVSGNISSKWHTGGIAGGINNSQSATIRNCINKANVIGYNSAGGIVGFSDASNLTSNITIENCNNYGNVTITGGGYAYTGAGGISGAGGKQIINCNNYGNINGVYTMGGIVGYIAVQNAEIINCINKGNVDTGATQKNAGGIAGYNARKLLIRNCINIGSVTGAGDKGGIIASSWGSNWQAEVELSIENSINVGNIKATSNQSGGIIGSQGTTAIKSYLYIKNSLNLGKVEGKQVGSIIGTISTSTSTETKTEFESVYCEGTAIGTGTLTSGEVTQKTASEMKSQSFVDLLNSNIGTNADWKRWKLGKDGYPTFEE